MNNMASPDDLITEINYIFKSWGSFGILFRTEDGLIVDYGPADVLDDLLFRLDNDTEHCNMINDVYRDYKLISFKDITSKGEILKLLNNEKYALKFAKEMGIIMKK